MNEIIYFFFIGLRGYILEGIMIIVICVYDLSVVLY